MRLLSRWMPLAVLLFVIQVGACYQQPVISPSRPLLCTSSTAKGECPKGFTCVANRVCAPNSCQKNEDCPAGLTCTSRGCVVGGDAGAADGGAIQIPELPDGGSGPDALAEPDAAAPATPDGGHD